MRRIGYFGVREEPLWTNMKKLILRHIAPTDAQARLTFSVNTFEKHRWMYLAGASPATSGTNPNRGWRVFHKGTSALPTCGQPPPSAKCQFLSCFTLASLLNHDKTLPTTTAITTRVQHQALRHGEDPRAIYGSADERFSTSRDFRGGGDGGDQPEVLLGRWPGQALLLSAIRNSPATTKFIDRTTSRDDILVDLDFPFIFPSRSIALRR